MNPHPHTARAVALAAFWMGAVAALGTAKTEYKITPDDLKKLDPRMQREVASLQYLMNAHQLRQFFALPADSARRDWITRFWARNDPTPATPKNEMKTEHYLRADIAQIEFKISAFPGWDKRGEVLIRYGFPDYRGTMPPEVTARKVHAPGELWFYRRHQMIVQFRDESLRGNFQYAITPFGDADAVSPELMEFLTYDAEETIQEQIPPQYLEFYEAPEMNETGRRWGTLDELFKGLPRHTPLRPRVHGTSEQIDEIASPDYERNLPANPSEVFYRDEAREYASNFEGVLEDTPSSYPFNFAKTSFTFYFGVDQFRGGDGVNRVEVNLEFPVEPVPGKSIPARSYHAEAIVMDATYRVVDKQKRDISLPSTLARAEGARLMPAQIVFTLPRGYYRVAVNMSDLDAKTASAYRTNVSARNFDDELAISDVLFAQKIATTAELSPFARGPLEVVPHPIRRYAVGTPVPVYFEVYELSLDERGLSDYEVEYRVVPGSDEKKSILDRFGGSPTVFASRFDGSGYHATEPLHITIKTENLKPGLYDFIVRVKDALAQSETFRQASFRVVEQSERPE
jgi:GWxTD domain-containing protein